MSEGTVSDWESLLAAERHLQDLVEGAGWSVEPPRRSTPDIA
jgi:hypothetical protein